MATDIDLNTVTREDSGTSHSRRMRRDGTVPAVVYGAGKDSIKVSISHNELLKKLNNEAFLNSILTIKVDDKEESVLIIKHTSTNTTSRPRNNGYGCESTTNSI